MLFIKLAWRNLLRNKRRTFIAGTAIGIGLAAMIFADALFEGMVRHMIRSATASYMGEAQVHRQGFRETLAVEQTIEDLDRATAVLDTTGAVAGYSVRTMSFGMLNSPANSSGISLVGIQPDKEPLISQIDDALAEGDFFVGQNQRDIVIGSRLADLLEVAIGDRVVATTTQAHTGDLVQEMFRVSGIYHFNVREMDEGLAFVRIDKARQMLALEGQAHEIAMVFTDPVLAEDKSIPMWQTLSAGNNEALNWAELMPQLSTVLQLTDFSMAITGIILFGVVAIGIINTLFMSIYERIFEFGVLRAVGTRPADLVRLVVFEAAGLSIVSIVIGCLIGAVASTWISHSGIDYGNLEFAGVTLRDRIYPVVQLSQYIVYPIWAFALTTLVGVYPALHAGRIAPARAMRKSF